MSPARSATAEGAESNTASLQVMFRRGVFMQVRVKNSKCVRVCVCAALDDTDRCCASCLLVSRAVDAMGLACSSCRYSALVSPRNLQSAGLLCLFGT